MENLFKIYYDRGLTDGNIATHVKNATKHTVKAWREQHGLKANKATDCEQLCFSCAHFATGCPWSEHFEPVPGWDAIPCIIPMNTGHRVESFRIRSCPLYADDTIGRMLEQDGTDLNLNTKDMHDYLIRWEREENKKMERRK